MAIITREQAAQIVGGEKKLHYLILSSFSDEIARLKGGIAKLVAHNRLGHNPTFRIVGDGFTEIMQALERGESGLLCGRSSHGRRGR